MMRWQRAEFEPTPEGLSSEHAGIGLTLVVKADHAVLAWQVNAQGATLPRAEAIALEVAEVIRAHLDSMGYVHRPEPEGG